MRIAAPWQPLGPASAAQSVVKNIETNATMIIAGNIVTTEAGAIATEPSSCILGPSPSFRRPPFQFQFQFHDCTSGWVSEGPFQKHRTFPPTHEMMAWQEVRPFIGDPMRYALLSLLLVPSLLLGQAPPPRPHAPKLQTISRPIEAWPEGAVSFVESPGLTLDGNAPHNSAVPDADGYRLLSLIVKPGEKLSFKLKSEDDMVTMQTYLPKPPPASLDWRLALRNANFPRSIVRNKMTIQNTTKEPQTLVLIIVGKHGSSYRVDLQRS
jgi:hypothetical protein